MKITFTKMHGCGNDFVVIDHRDERLCNIDLPAFVEKVCTRKYGIGANGLMLLEKSEQADFKMVYFNADGSEGEMCGNGARCIARFAYIKGVADKEMTFETHDGYYKAKVLSDQTVRVYFPDVEKHALQLKQQMILESEALIYHQGFVGVPHTVVFREKEIEMDVAEFEHWGREIREQPVFPAGTNVNLVKVTGQHAISIRTYERGVEEETLACGSGACASAIMAAVLGKGFPPFDVQTAGGTLGIDFTQQDDKFTDITLSGNAVIVYEGIFNV